MYMNSGDEVLRSTGKESEIQRPQTEHSLLQDIKNGPHSDRTQYTKRARPDEGFFKQFRENPG